MDIKLNRELAIMNYSLKRKSKTKKKNKSISSPEQ